MLKKTVTYETFDGETVTEDFYFNLTKAELSDRQFSVEGGLSALLEQVTKTNDQNKMYSIFKEIILTAYGEKSADGRKFIKSKEISENFSHTEAYSTIFMELLSDVDAAVAFVTGILPKDLQSNVKDSFDDELKKLGATNLRNSSDASTTS